VTKASLSYAKKAKGEEHLNATESKDGKVVDLVYESGEAFRREE
jgi:hypothetical protein